MKTLRCGRINFRFIHCFEILKFEVCSLFWDFFRWQFHLLRTYTERMHPAFTSHSTDMHSGQITHPYAQVIRQSRKCEKSLCTSYFTAHELESKNATLKACISTPHLPSVCLHRALAPSWKNNSYPSEIFQSYNFLYLWALWVMGILKKSNA